jgi:transposase
MNQEGGPSAMEYKRVAIDTSKHVFTLHAVDASGRPVLRRDLSRARLVPFLSSLPPTEIALEACGSSNHWAREAIKHGHQAKLIPPQYARQYRKRGKNDRTDAEAINEAADRPTMRFVPVKSEEQQAASMLMKTRGLLIGQRTQLVNAIRGHAGEFGIVVARGISNLRELREKIAASSIPEAAREAIELLAAQADDTDARLTEIDRKLATLHKSNEVSQRLAVVPGIGLQTALTLATTVDAATFESGRHFAAWLGLTPKQHSTGGKQRLGGISKAGNERLRSLLVTGAMAVIRHVRPGGRNATPWLLKLLERKPRKVAAVALANKMARVAWAMMARGEAYRRSPVAV